MRRLIFLILAAALLSPVCLSADIIRSNKSAGKLVALTFDDGPHCDYTTKILDILKMYNIKATFFIVGENAAAMPDRIKQIYNEGHTLGNHTYSHKFITKISKDKLVEEIKKTEDIIFEISGERPKFFRPPGGLYNEDALKVLADMGYVSVLWSQDTKDWTLPTVEKISQDVLSNVSDGDIILFHDFNRKNSPTPDALIKIIPKLLDMGYSFVTIPELLAETSFCE